MQPTTSRVVLIVEFSPGVQSRKNHFQCRLLHFRMFVDRDTSPVILNRTGGAVFMQGDRNSITFACEKLIHRIVDDFPKQVMQSARIHAPNVHRRTTSHRFQAFQHFDIFASVR